MGRLWEHQAVARVHQYGRVVLGGIPMAQTAVLGDSHDSEGLPLPPSNDEEVYEEDLAVNGRVGSELGDPYVDSLP